MRYRRKVWGMLLIYSWHKDIHLCSFPLSGDSMHMLIRWSSEIYYMERDIFVGFVILYVSMLDWEVIFCYRLIKKSKIKKKVS